VISLTEQTLGQLSIGTSWWNPNKFQYWKYPPCWTWCYDQAD